MTRTVLDASAALAWLLPSQATSASHAFLAGSSGGYVAPFVFEWEVKNVLLSRVHRRRMSVFDFADALAQLDAYGIEVADPARPDTLLELALDERVSLFDASYLALALETSSAVATKDADLVVAASRRSLAVHDLRDF